MIYLRVIISYITYMTSKQNTFVNGLKNTFENDIQNGENGAFEYTSKGMGGSRRIEGALVAWNAGVTRLTPASKINELIDNIFTNLDDDKEQSAIDIINLFKSVFVKRDCREGEGERMVVYHALFKLYDYYPNTVIKLLEIIPEFGYWKDMQNIYLMAFKLKNDKGQSFMVSIRKIWNDTFLKDLSTFKNKTNEPVTLSLMTKYWPKEGRSLDKRTKISHILAKEIIINNKPIGLKVMREYLSLMNEAINTTEILTSSKRWDEIQFNLVPSRLMTLGKKSFLNIDNNGTMKHPTDAIRMKCRENLLEHIELAKQGKTKVHGGQMYIHEIIKQYFSNYTPTAIPQELQDICELQWNEHRENLIKVINDNPQCNLHETLILSDFSGSMLGDPILVSTAMALMISSVTKGPFADMFMTFETKPRLLSINRNDSLCEKINYVINTPWGGSTDIISAFETILETCVRDNLNPEDLPKQFMIISDMQFNKAHLQMSNNYPNVLRYSGNQSSELKGDIQETHHEILSKAFHNAGLAICGKAYKLPTIVYWNVRGNTDGFPVKADTPNTQILTGFSVTMIKNLLSGNEVKDPTPYDNFLQSISCERYDIIQNMIYEVAEPDLFIKHAIEKQSDDASGFSDWDDVRPSEADEFNNIKHKMEYTQTKMNDMMEQLKNLNSNN